MVETIVTSSLSAIKEKNQIEGENKAPKELIDLIERHPYSKVDGYIYGNKSAKIINEKVQSTAPIVHSYYKETINSLLGKGDEEAMNNQNSTDTLFNELKNDMREREARARQEISDREERFERQLERFANEAQNREERIRQEAKEREERVTTLLTGMNNKIDGHASHIETMKNQNWWGNVGMFGALVAILIALIVALVTLIN